MQTQQFDAIVIGAGLGGLLSAVQLLQRGKRVIILERLPHCGGRFTAKTFRGAQISTGAVHMLPFGSVGVLAHALRPLPIPNRIFDAAFFGSFHIRGQQIRSRGVLGVFKVLGPRQFFWFSRAGWLMFFKPLPAAERSLPFDIWLASHIDVQRNPELLAFFASISRFALSLELHQVTAEEVIRTTRHMFRFGAPGILQGGCGALTAELERRVLEQGAELRLHSDVLLIPHKGIMYCLDTQRIAGMVQPTNSDPRLAPEGKHLLISHQVIQSANIEEEKALALADLRTLFGKDFEQHCHILTMSAYRGEWPVNRLAQGSDIEATTALQGLYQVGDAAKPAGYLMVE